MCDRNSIEKQPIHFEKERSEQELFESYESSPFENPDLDDSYSCVANRLSPFLENVLVYIAGWVRRVSSTIKCVDCIGVLTCDANSGVESNALLVLKDNGGLMHPSPDLVKIVTIAEKVLRLMVNLKNVTKSRTSLGIKLEIEVLKRIPKNLFQSNEVHFQESMYGCNNHLYSLVRLICRSFLNCRRHHITRCTNIQSHQKVVRQFNNKMTLFQNQ